MELIVFQEAQELANQQQRINNAGKNLVDQTGVLSAHISFTRKILFANSVAVLEAPHYL